MTQPAAATQQRDYWVAAGMAVSATSAAVSSFAGLRGLAVVAGWPVRLAPLLPLTVDAYAMTATRVWLSQATGSRRARRFARINAVSAIGLSVAGNAIYHLIALHLLTASWVVVVVVGAAPALVLGLVSHLAVLRAEVDGDTADRFASRRDESFNAESDRQSHPQQPNGPRLADATGRDAASSPLRPESVLSPAPGRPEDPGRYRTDAQLSQAARAADQQYRTTHGGRPIPRDELRRVLHVGGGKATALLRQLKAQQAAGPSP